MRKVILFLIVFFVGLASSFAQVREHYLLGTVENLPPYSFSKNGQLQGIDIEFVQAIAKQLGITIQIEPMPWVRVIASLQKGAIDGAFSLYEVAERKSYCNYVAVVHYDNLGIATRKNNAFSFKSTQDLFGKVVGKGSGVFVSDEFTRAVQDKKITVEEINDTNMQNIAKLFAGRVEVVIGVEETMRFYAQALGLADEIIITNNSIQKNRPGYLVFSKFGRLADQTKRSQEFRTAIQTLISDGSYARIVQKYYQSFSPQ